MKKMLCLLAFSLFLPVLAFSLFLPVLAFAEDSLDNIALMALSPLDERAVIKLPDNKMQVLKIGDRIGSTEARLVQVLSNRIVLEELRRKHDGVQARETVWLYKAENGVSRIERLRKEPPPAPPVMIEKSATPVPSDSK